MNFIRNLLGICPHEWSGWVIKQVNRTKTHHYLPTMGMYVPMSEPMEYTDTWQERSCKKCGLTVRRSL